MLQEVTTAVRLDGPTYAALVRLAEKRGEYTRQTRRPVVSRAIRAVLAAGLEALGEEVPTGAGQVTAHNGPGAR